MLSTHILLQNFVLIQPRTSPPKICNILRTKLHLHLFTLTNENIRTNTQYRCHFRRRMFNVVGYYSVCSTTSAPPPLTFFNFRMFFLSLPFLPFCGVCAAFSHSQVRSTRVCLSSFNLSFHKNSNVFSFPYCDVYAFFE